MDTKCSNFWERTLYRYFRNDLLGLFGANSNLSEVFYANIITILAVLDIKGVVGVMCEFEIFVCKSRSFNDLVILVQLFISDVCDRIQTCSSLIFPDLQTSIN